MRSKGGYIENQAEIFNAIKNYIEENKIPPTIRELCEILEIKSTSTVWEYIKQLKVDGYISMTDSSNRSIRIEKDFYKITEPEKCGIKLTKDELQSKGKKEFVMGRNINKQVGIIKNNYNISSKTVELEINYMYKLNKLMSANKRY